MTKLALILLVINMLYSCNQAQTRQNIKKPSDGNATRETVDLYRLLFDSMEKGIMLGHQDDLAYGHGWYKEMGRSDVKEITGDYPAVVGWELGHLEIGAEYNLDSVYFDDMKEYIKEFYKQGGITTVSWHGDNIVTQKTAWDSAQDSVVRTVLPQGSNHVAYLSWLKRLADFFLDLKDENGKPIPVVFRMYHEHTGDWFWWGRKQCTPQEYKQLWIMTVEYLRDKCNVHNLLYCYSPANVPDSKEFFRCYPGDEYVDIIGFDSYVYGENQQKAIETYQKALQYNLDIITEYAEQSGKIPIIGETGMESIPYPHYFTEIVYPIISRYKIAWVLFWRNAWEKDKPQHHYLPFKEHPSEEDFIKFVSMPDILMNDDIRNH